MTLPTVRWDADARSEHPHCMRAVALHRVHPVGFYKGACLRKKKQKNSKSISFAYFAFFANVTFSTVVGSEYGTEAHLPRTSPRECKRFCVALSRRSGKGLSSGSLHLKVRKYRVRLTVISRSYTFRVPPLCCYMLKCCSLVHSCRSTSEGCFGGRIRHAPRILLQYYS